MDISPPSPDRAQALTVLRKVFYSSRSAQSNCNLAAWEVIQRELICTSQTTPQQVEKAIQSVLLKLIHSLHDQLSLSKPEYAERCLQILQTQLQHRQPVDSFTVNVLNISRSQYYRDLDRGLELLADLLVAEEASAKQSLYSSLPPASYSRLFGVEALIESLLAAIQDPAYPSIMVVDGLGGIGKTSVGREVAWQVTNQGIVKAVFWKTAQRVFFTWDQITVSNQPALTRDVLLDSLAEDLGCPEWSALPMPQKLRQLRYRLGEFPVLIVIDNLETAADINALMDIAVDLTHNQPTHILITSRRRLEWCRPLACFHLHPLTSKDGEAFIRYFAAERGMYDLAKAPSKQLRQIHNAVGGHPLAIKLVISQLEALSISQALDGIKRSKQMDLFYNYIYHNSWEVLSTPARQALLALVHTPPTGGCWDEILTFSGLAENELASALLELVRFSLVDATGETEKNYHLHPLTRQFILKELARVNDSFVDQMK